jgi:hypothetical protein
MEAFFQRLQDSDFGVWVSSAPTIWAFPMILTMHTVGLAMIVGPNAVLDLRLLGAGTRVPIAELRNVFRIMWVGLAINASTGVALFISEAAEKGFQRIFYVKLTLIALAVIVAVRTKRVVFGHDGHDGRDGHAGQPGHAAAAVGDFVPGGAKALAVLSLILWMGAITVGKLMEYIKW